MNTRLDRTIFTLTFVALCGATTRPSAVLNDAISALAAEYQAVLKDPEKPIRVECDFFKRNPASVVITQSDVLPLLERTGGDVRIACYVKWQLLSAFDGKFDDANENRAIAVYKRAPNLMLRPGISESDRRELEKAAQGQIQDSLDLIDQKLIDAVGKFNAYNGQILRYRTELYTRLPVRYESVLAGLDDAAERLSSGVDDIDTKPFAAAIVADARSWVASKPDPKRLAVMEKAVSKLAAAQGPMYYSALRWSKREQRLIWSQTQRNLNFNGELESLAAELNKQLAESQNSTPAPKPD